MKPVSKMMSIITKLMGWLINYVKDRREVEWDIERLE